MATGGFSPRSQSLGAYHSVYLETVVMVFMILAGSNFSLHFFAWRSRLRVYWQDAEWRFYVLGIAVSTLLVAIVLWQRADYRPGHAIQEALFQTVSSVTTTGFATADLEKWPIFCQYMTFLLMFFGGCTGSTGGAIKPMRLLLLAKHAYWQLYRLLHPRAVVPLRLGAQTITNDILLNVQAFFVLYIASFVLATV
jgi:trk system potassium uptake protein TrkH